MYKRCLLGAAILGLAGAVHAEFRLFADDEAERQEPRPAEIAGARVHYADAPVFLERGVASEARIVPESATAVPIEEALHRLLPRGWTATLDASARAFEVSWRGGESWLAIVRGIAQCIGTDALVDWAHDTVVIGPQVRDAWVLEPGSLRANLERWASRAGWRFQWAVPWKQDLTVPHSAVLPLGLDIQGAVNLVVESYRQERVLNLKAEFYEGNLLIVLRCDAGGC